MSVIPALGLPGKTTRYLGLNSLAVYTKWWAPGSARDPASNWGGEHLGKIPPSILHMGLKNLYICIHIQICLQKIHTHARTDTDTHTCRYTHACTYMHINEQRNWKHFKWKSCIDYNSLCFFNLVYKQYSRVRAMAHHWGKSLLYKHKISTLNPQSTSESLAWCFVYNLNAEVGRAQRFMLSQPTKDGERQIPALSQNLRTRLLREDT